MTYKIYTLGCKVNEYESEVIGDIFENHGFTESDDPDVAIINTCTVTNTADSKSRKLIRSVRKQFPNAVLMVAGCMTQNKKDNLDGIDADVIIGTNNKTELINYLEKYKKEKKRIIDIDDISKAKFETMKLNNFDLTRAYIKIEDGCDNYCTFCIIPFVRGHVRCKKHEDVIKEATDLVNEGHKEIVLTGIHTGHYFDGNYSFADLLSDLVKIPGLKRLRISSIEATEVNDHVLDVIKNSDVLVNHMHIPLQTGSNQILKDMNRKYNKDYFIKKIEKIRSIKPDMSITTDVIVGFPGETDEMFEESVETIKKIGFNKIHVFPYSDRAGTVASEMKNKIPGNIKKERVHRLLDISRKAEIKFMNDHVGKEMIFIPEVYEDGYLIGHTGNYIHVKAKGDENMLREEVKVVGMEVNYPYLISEIRP